jgi:PKD repeat protein
LTATVTDNLGASASTSSSVSISPGSLTLTAPAASSTSSSPVHIVASAVSGNPITATWIYIDNVVQYKTTSASVDTYLALSAGSHYISAQAWDSQGNVFVQRWTFTVNAPPVAALSLTQSSAYAPATVTASTAGSTDSGGTIAASSIDFGDGTVVSGTTASHVYKTAGTYTVRATVTDNSGLSSSTSKTVTVKPPTVTITSPINGAWVHSPVYVVASAASGAKVSAVWVYVDNIVKYQTSLSSVNTYIGMSKGTHIITVKAWDATGALFTSTVKVNVY